jgi:hypothetical protein
VTSYVGAATDGGNLEDLSITLPSVQAGDVAVLLWLMQNTSTPTTPSGFTLPSSALVDGDSGSMRMGLYWRALPSGGSVTLDGSASNRQSAVLAVYRGAHETAPISAWEVRDEGSSVSSHPCPEVTPLHDGCVILSGVGERASSGTTGWTTTYTERADSVALATGTGGTICAIADDGLATLRTAGVGVTPPNWVSGSAFASANVLTWSIALRPLDSARPPRLVAAMPVAVRRASAW